jgi:hypothetical protein
MEHLDSLALTFVAEPPARGAGLNQVIGLTIAAMVLSGLMLVGRVRASDSSDQLAGQLRRLDGR